MRISTIVTVVGGLLAANGLAGELKSGWLLAVDPQNIGKTNGWASALHAEARTVPVPGVIQQVHPTYSGVAWYYRNLDRLPMKTAENDRYVLSFGAVDYFSEVFIDGRKVGENEGAENPFALDVTERIRPGSLIAVRVVNPKADVEIDGFEMNTVPHRNKFDGRFNPGWCYNTGGLTLPVSLDAVPAVRVLDAFVKADWKTGHVTVAVTMRNDSGGVCTRDLVVAVRRDDLPYPVCRRVLTRRLEQNETVFETDFDVPDFALWSLETPTVYTLEVDGYATRFGFRDFRLEKGWFTLNGKRVFLKSAHTGNHMPGGLAVVDAHTPELEFRDFQLMKACGYNCVRFIATQATPRQLDYCDRLGLMVYQETYASWRLGDHPQAKRRFLDSLRAEVKRDRNHPSLTIWGAINEMKQGNAVEAARGMLPEMRRLDPTRLWIYSSGRWDLFPAKTTATKMAWATQPEGRVPDWTVGSASNPGSTTWDCVWGDDGNPAGGECGDLHFYPGYPHDGDAVKKLRGSFAATKPGFISEYGVGSALNVIDHCLEFERCGISSDAPDYALMRSIRDRFLADWKAWGLDRVFASPVDFLRASERMNARSRREGFDLIRSNPRFVGYNLTGALDHAICGEGPMSLFRRMKDGNFDVLRDGWSDLRWCLFLGRSNLHPGEEMPFEAVLADFDVLAPGEYTARFVVADKDGRTCFETTRPFSVPQLDADGLRKVAYPVWKDTVKLNLVPGRYCLRAYLDHGGRAEASEKVFHVSPAPDPLIPNQGDWLVVKASDEEKGRAALEVVKNGGRALVLLGENGERAARWIPLQGFACRRESHWLYHKETLVLPHRFFEGCPLGFFDWDFYEGMTPRYGFVTTETPISLASVNFDVGGPGEYRSSINLAEFAYGKGTLVLCTFPLDRGFGPSVKARILATRKSGR